MPARLVLGVMLLCGLLWAQSSHPQLGLEENKPQKVAYTSATIVTEPGKTLTKATLLVNEGRIEAVGTDVKIPVDARVVDVEGRFIYPGFVEPYARYGVPELKKGERKPGPEPTIEQKGRIYWNEAVRSQRNAADEFLADKKEAEQWRKAGFTTIQTNGLDGIFQGVGAVVSSNEEAPNRLILNPASAQFLSFSKGSATQDYPGSLMGSIALIRQALNDAQWYGKAWNAFSKNPAQARPEQNVSLSALLPVVEKKQPVIFEVNNHLDLLRAAAIAEEFGLRFIYKSGGDSYKDLGNIGRLNSTLIVPLNFPDKPDVADADRAADVSLEELKEWDAAPENPARLAGANVRFAFTSHDLKNKDDYLKNIRLAVKRGLDETTALDAMTRIPANIAGVDKQAGSLKPGMLASFVICDGNLFEDDTQIESLVVEGAHFEISEAPETDARGVYDVAIDQSGRMFKMDISGKLKSPKASFMADSVKLESSNFSISGSKVTFNISADTLGFTGVTRFTGRLTEGEAAGSGLNADGSVFAWTAKRVKPFEEKEEKKETDEQQPALFPTVYPDMAYGRKGLPDQPQVVAVTNATIWTAGEQGTLQNADMIVKNGKISAVGKGLSIPDNALVIDGSGLHVTPGIIDEHSHIAISRGVNEGSQAVTSEVRIGDVVDPTSIHIYRQLAGGVTTSQLLHGSANPIGGQAQVIKLRWGADAEGLKFKEAPPTIKFALGENVKQSNWGDYYTSRYPQTRMGVREIMYDTFRRARAYEQEWKGYNALSSSKKESTVPPRRDLELEAIVEILNSERFIHCHSYVQSEILMLMRLAEEFGFTVGTFTHILEGYKVASEMAEHGAMASTFSDWWAYKFEVYEAIPYNTALMHRAGVVTSVNSDDAEMARRLNQESAKAIKYGDVTEEDALKFCTINAAKQLKVEQYVGSLEAGKHADFVLWNDNPLSVYAKVQQTWIDGRRYFDIAEDQALRAEITLQRNALIQKALDADGPAAKAGKKKASGSDYDCLDVHDYVGGLQ